MNSHDIARELRAEKAKQNLSTSTLAERLGMSEHQVRRRLSGAVSLKVKESEAFADALGVPLLVLMERSAA